MMRAVLGKPRCPCFDKLLFLLVARGVFTFLICPTYKHPGGTYWLCCMVE